MEVGTQGSRLALPWVLAGCRRKLWGISLEADMITRGKATQIGHVRSMHAPARTRTHTHSISYTHTIMHTCILAIPYALSRDLPAQRIAPAESG